MHYAGMQVRRIKINLHRDRWAPVSPSAEKNPLEFFCEPTHSNKMVGLSLCMNFNP
jgi:hypothetical protein